MGVPVITTPKGYTRGTVNAPDPAKVAQNLTRELEKIERAQPNMRTVQITADYDVDPRDRTILVDTTAGDVTINLRSALQLLVLPLDIIKTSSDGHSVQVMAVTGESIGGPLGALTGLVWSEMGVGFSFHPDGVGQWWIEGSAVTWGTVTGTSAPNIIQAIANLADGVADKIIYFTGAAAAAFATLTVEREPGTITTASLAHLATETGTVAMSALLTALVTIATDRDAWIRLYTDATSLAGDAARALGTQAQPGIGLLGEFSFSSGGSQSINVSPIAWLANDEATPVARVHYSIQNRSGATSTVEVTLGYATDTPVR